MSTSAVNYDNIGGSSFDSSTFIGDDSQAAFFSIAGGNLGPSLRRAAISKRLGNGTVRDRAIVDRPGTNVIDIESIRPGNDLTSFGTSTMNVPTTITIGVYSPSAMIPGATMMMGVSYPLDSNGHSFKENLASGLFLTWRLRDF